MRITHAIGLAVIVPTLLSIAGCSSNDSTGPDDDGNTSTMSGTINGDAWTATVIVSTKVGTRISITGRDAQNREVVFDIYGVTAAGPFSIGQGQTSSAQFSVPGDAWAGHLSGASGTITISTLSATHAVGSFDVNLMPLTTTATGARRIVGTFTVYFMTQT